MQITVTLSHTGLRTVKQTLKCFGRVRQQRRLFSQMEVPPQSLETLLSAMLADAGAPAVLRLVPPRVVLALLAPPLGHADVLTFPFFLPLSPLPCPAAPTGICHALLPVPVPPSPQSLALLMMMSR